MNEPSTSVESNRSKRRRPSLVLTDRDVLILRDLFDSRILTTAQIADIHFGGSRNAAKQRLWAMKKARWIACRFSSPAAQPQPIRLTRDGFELLRERGHLHDYPRVTWLTMSKRLKVSDLTLRHEIDVGSLKAAFHRSARERGGTTILTAVTWPRLLRFQARPAHASDPVHVSPDGFLRINYNDDAITRQIDLFIECDRSTESLPRIVERMQGYVAYFQAGGYAKRQLAALGRATSPIEPKDFPFRVLWTFRTRSRLEHFLCACQQHVRPIHKMAWAAVHDDVVRDPFGPIWQRPIDRGQSHSLLPPITGSSPLQTN